MTNTVKDNRIEIRCPHGPRRLFAMIIAKGDKPSVVDNLWEFACDDCRTFLKRRRGMTSVKLVLHRYNILGELIETVYEED